MQAFDAQHQNSNSKREGKKNILMTYIFSLSIEKNDFAYFPASCFFLILLYIWYSSFNFYINLFFFIFFKTICGQKYLDKKKYLVNFCKTLGFLSCSRVVEHSLDEHVNFDSVI